jgi:NADH oxidase (H2O2-forming)
VIVGAGLVGIEMAQAFRRRGIDVTIVEMSDRVLPNLLEKEMAEIVKRELEDNGVKVILGEGVEELYGKSATVFVLYTFEVMNLAYIKKF